MRIDWRIHPSTADTLAHKHDRVFLDGVDVTDGCFLADTSGLVGNYLRDESGHFYRMGNEPAQEFRRGHVTIRGAES